MSRLAWLVVTLATVLCSAGVAVGQEGDPPMQPTFRAGVGIVQVPVIVRDRKGQPVYGLSRDTFTVLDRGRPMTLVGFEEVRRVDDAPPAPRDIVLVIDDLNTRPDVMPRAIQAARELLQRLEPDDRVALINTSTLPDVRQDATTNRAIIDRDLRRVRGQYMTGPGRFWAIQQSLSVLRSVCEQLAREATGARRYTLVLFSEGYGFNPFDQSGWVDLEILRDVRAITGRAAQASVAIYAIHAAGLEMTGGGVRGRTVPTTGSPVGTAGGFAFASSLSTIDDLSALAALAHDTGGRLTRWTNDLLANVPQMLSDADEYYLLSYEMPDLTDGERGARVPVARQIDVRVAQPGVEVRARQSYVHPEGMGRQGR